MSKLHIRAESVIPGMTVPLIPRAVLFGNPVRVGPRLSPDAERMSYLAPVDGVMNVWVGATGKNDYRAVTRDRDRGIARYFWSEDGRYILYLQDVGGNENWRLYSVELDTGRIQDLTPFEDVQAQILDHNKRFPDELLIGLNRDRKEVHDVYRLRLSTGELTLAARNPGNIADWTTDAHMQVRAAVATTPDGGFDLLIRDNDQSEWQPRGHWEPEDALDTGPICFSQDGRYLYLKDSQGSNAARLVRMNLQTNQRDVILEDPEYDIGGLIIHPDTYKIQAAGFTRARDEWVVLDESIREDLAEIRKIHPGDFFLCSRDHADENWLVGFTADHGPVPYYAYHRKTRQATFLFDHRPELNQYRLSPMEPVSFSARDGLMLHGYLTLPPGTEESGNLPLVLNVHGGPWHRDTWGFHPEAQWLANRGYACLQVNFRGSTGYGKKFLNAGDREWGGKMHNDLEDAVNWAIRRGVADPKRIAIYGGSYGGYAALVGATFTPELFTCAVAIVGPSNLITFIRSIPPYWSTFLAMLQKRVGNPDTEPEFLTSRSPLSRVDQIRIPMLIAQGANDPRVKQAESEQIVEAMRTKGIPHDYLLFPDEGHGFAKPENRLKFYAHAEHFLARHLGGRSEE